MSAVMASPTTICTSGDAGWDDARRAWNLAVDQHPAAVALPACAQDVAEVVRFAGRHGLRVAPAEADALVAPLQALRPATDTIQDDPREGALPGGTWTRSSPRPASATGSGSPACPPRRSTPSSGWPSRRCSPRS